MRVQWLKLQLKRRRLCYLQLSQGIVTLLLTRGLLSTQGDELVNAVRHRSETQQAEEVCVCVCQGALRPDVQLHFTNTRGQAPLVPNLIRYSWSSSPLQQASVSLDIPQSHAT